MQLQRTNYAPTNWFCLLANYEQNNYLIANSQKWS